MTIPEIHSQTTQKVYPATLVKGPIGVNSGQFETVVPAIMITPGLPLICLVNQAHMLSISASMITAIQGRRLGQQG